MNLLKPKVLVKIGFVILIHLAEFSYIAKEHGREEIIIQGTLGNLAKIQNLKVLLVMQEVF